MKICRNQMGRLFIERWLMAGASTGRDLLYKKRGI